MNEVVRKFFLKNLPDLTGKKMIHTERYILFLENNVELRIQSKNDIYELERKIKNSEISRQTSLIEITKEEFELLKKLSIKNIVRDSYILRDSPEIALRIYRGEFEGLIRLEVDFNSEEEAKNFVPPDEYGVEITKSALGMDGCLAKLFMEEFLNELNQIKRLILTP